MLIGGLFSNIFFAGLCDYLEPSKFPIIKPFLAFISDLALLPVYFILYKTQPDWAVVEIL